MRDLLLLVDREVKPDRSCIACGQAKNADTHTYDHDYVKPQASSRGAIARFNASPEGVAYRAEAAEAVGKPCKLGSPDCTGTAQHLHEILPRGRAGGLAAALRDGPPPVRACDACNDYIGTHPAWARERGLLLSQKDLP